MIDIENQIFTAVATALRAEFPSITVEGITNYSPSSFPFVSLEETDNYSYDATRDTNSNNNHSVVTYEANIYSNKTSTRKSEAKDILAVLDTTLLNLGFTRTVRQPINLDDASKYRIFARYVAIVGEDETIYRR